MMGNAVKVEFYDADAENPQRALVVALDTYAVPDAGELVSIRGEVWEAIRRTWCVDASDDVLLKTLRANVDLRRWEAR